MLPDAAVGAPTPPVRLAVCHPLAVELLELFQKYHTFLSVLKYIKAFPPLGRTNGVPATALGPEVVAVRSMVFQGSPFHHSKCTCWSDPT